MDTITGATFIEGDVVRATQDTVSLIKDETYTVYRVLGCGEVFYARRYWVKNSEGDLFFVKNGHINFTLAN